MGGAVLIALGALLFAQNFTAFTLHNWWALFILLPALGAFTAAWRNYQEAGRVTAAVSASLFGGILLCLVSASFLLGLNWAIVGPVLLILAGVVVLVNGWLKL